MTAAGWGGASDSKEVAKGSREEQIYYYENRIDRLQSSRARAASDLHVAEARLQQRGDEATIKVLREEQLKAALTLHNLEKEEAMLLAKLKPLYGVVSRQFFREQRDHIKRVMAFAQEASYDNAFYGIFFDLFQAESLSDLVAMFVERFVINYMIFYPLGVLYYALWSAPWSVWAYSSGISSVVPGLLAYVLSVFIMCTPLIALLSGLYFLVRRGNMNRFQRYRRHQD
ncbi:hypothetical protein STCU_05103 [Strigomonas culicis]|uniref:Uncharacterized protein n=1 Tax=Strigomonas culicis TaxID=28005 RepID=S9UCD5_9TRYP|nr:hypothetical protein STCU_05103 [Strigomonas culicis]|eukprot:EPY28477.1 hypothetical protein STCU_05103 [Strigomonas culicis]